MKKLILLSLIVSGSFANAFDLGGTIGSAANSLNLGGTIGGAANEIIGGYLGGLKKKVKESKVQKVSEDPNKCKQDALSSVEAVALSECATQYNSKCNIIINAHITREPEQMLSNNGPVSSTARGKGNSTSEAESDAVKQAESSALSQCMKKTGLACEIFSAGRVTSSARENPSVTIGGLKGPKYDAYAEASARPSGRQTTTYACEAAATAQTKGKF